MALNYYIKAIKDSTAVTTPVLAVESSDTQMIAINDTNPTIPVIQPQANVPFGIPKLDANGKVPLAQIPNTTSNNLGFFDASPNLLPVGTFASGDTYTISVAGTLTVYDPVTLVAAPTLCPVNGSIQYITGSPTNPTGWYLNPPPSSDTFVLKDAPSGAAYIPTGTTAQRPSAPWGGAFRFNDQTTQFEGYNGTAWGTVGGGATGAPNNPFIYENDIHVTADYTITTGKNAMSAGPIEVDNGVTVTVPAGSTWSVI